MPSKYIVHRRLRSAINCYAQRKRERQKAEDGGDLERLPSRSSNKIRFKIQCVTYAIHEWLRRSAVTQLSRRELIASCKMQLRSRRWFLGKYIERELLSHLLLSPPLCGTYYRVHAETAGVASEKPVGVTRTIYILM